MVVCAEGDAGALQDSVRRVKNLVGDEVMAQLGALKEEPDSKTTVGAQARPTPVHAVVAIGLSEELYPADAGSLYIVGDDNEQASRIKWH